MSTSVPITMSDIATDNNLVTSVTLTPSSSTSPVSESVKTDSFMNGIGPSRTSRVKFGTDYPTSSRNPDFNFFQSTLDYYPPRVGIKVSLPPFWSDAPRVWFQSADGVFRQNGIISEYEKYDLVLCALDSRHMTRVEHIICHKPQDKPYTALKEALLKEFELDESQRLNQLLYNVQLGDLKPTELLFQMKKLLGNFSDDNPVVTSLLKKLFLDKLPLHCRQILAGSLEADLDVLAWRADEIMSHSDKTHPAEVRVPNVNSNLSSMNAVLTKRVDMLETELARLRMQRHVSNNRPDTNQRSFARPSRSSRSPQRDRFYSNQFRPNFSPSSRGAEYSGRAFNDERPCFFPGSIDSAQRPRRNFNPPNRKLNAPNLCFYHSRYGRNALKCQSPCGWRRDSLAKNA
ncbi:uncharacterized protein LOC143461851 [Clavelina lepadiformis]|uniref:uncharacterized protein LOC143461851 n=1 Tax=Clavelina lepadiformis TaxID=159417 RepID=UPI004041D318